MIGSQPPRRLRPYGQAAIDDALHQEVLLFLNMKVSMIIFTLPITIYLIYKDGRESLFAPINFIKVCVAPMRNVLKIEITNLIEIS